MSTVPLSHIRIYRAIEGAVINCADAHPGWSLTRDMARSIAKRAAGTLKAQLPEVLAAKLPSDVEAQLFTGAAPHLISIPAHRTKSERRGDGPLRTPPLLFPPKAGRRYRELRRSGYNVIWRELSIRVGKAKADADTAKADVLIEVLRMVDEMRSLDK